MGAKQDTFQSILRAAGYTFAPGSHPLPSADQFRRYSLDGEIGRVFAALGGRGEWSKPGPWDCELGGMVLELDEHLHFNRYRLVTLESPLYQRLSRFPLAKYRAYCREREPECLRAGRYRGKWSSGSCERMFGPGCQPGTLDGAGSPRWKQRAFYDFLKDIAFLAGGPAVPRVSIWDQLTEADGSTTVLEVLRMGGGRWVPSLDRLIRSRVHAPQA